MLSRETLESYRRMTPAERLRLTFKLSEDAWRALAIGSPEVVVARRFELLRRQNDERNRNMLEGLARTRRPPDDAPQPPPQS